jgi:heat shock protein HslJ
MLELRRNLARLVLGGLLAPIFCCDASSDGLRAQLDGRDFLLQSAEGFTPVARTTVRLSFHDGDLSISADCNSHSGPYKLRDQRVVVNGLGATEIGCEAPLQAQDEWLARFITASPGLVLADDQLTLTGSEAKLVFLDREVANPDRPLTDRSWSVDTFISGGAASNLPLSADPTLLFRADGSFTVDTTCNTGSGSYRVADDQLTLSNVTYTDAACAGPAMFAETELQRVLGNGTLTFGIEAARLTLMRGELGIAAITP